MAPNLNSRNIEYANFLKYQEDLKTSPHTIFVFINFFETSKELELFYEIIITIHDIINLTKK